MKKIIFIVLLISTFSCANMFEDLLGKNKNYLFKHNFRCNDGICITSEKNVFNNKALEDSIKVVKVFLDNKDNVFKVELELKIYNEQREAFFNAILKSSSKSRKIKYKSYIVNDKYGNHPFIDITDLQRRKRYINYMSEIFYNNIKNYKK